MDNKLQSQPTFETQKPDNNENKLQNLSPEQQEKLKKLGEDLENVKAGLRFVGDYKNSLSKGVENTTIEDDEDAKEIKLLQEKIVGLEKQYQDLQTKKGNIDNEISSFEKSKSEVKNQIESMEYKLGVEIDEKGEVKKMSKTPEEMVSINSEQFLKIPENERLQYITKNNIDASRVASGEIKDVEFNFTYNGQFNQELYLYTTAGQVLPNEVRSLISDGISYERIGLNGEFYNKETSKRLIIKEGTNISVEKLGSAEELEAMDKEIAEKYQKYVKENPKFADEQYKSAIIESYKKGLGDIELGIILNQSYGEISKLTQEQAEKLLVVTRHLDNSNILGSYIDAGELITKLEEIVGVIKQYGAGLKYSVDQKGGIKFSMGADGLPEGLELEPSLQKFVKIALSQIGTHERDGGADKYLGGKSSRSIPWCAGFVNWCLEVSGYKGTGSLSSQSFINGSGYGHVGIKLGSKVLGGNQSNQVSLMNINKPIVGYSIPGPNGLEVHKPAGDPNKIPDGAIIVFNRDTKRDTNFA